MSNFEQYGLDVIHCEKCGDRGYITERTGNGCEIRVTECECMNTRRSLRALYRSGLQELVERYTFQRFQTPDGDALAMKEKALQYCAAPPAWFFVSGWPGSGKTHICTAICSRLIREGQRVYYCKWTEETGKLKTLKAMDPPPKEYLEKLELLRSVPVLYVDDFLKTKPTAADMALAFDIINARYNRPSLRTVISSNRSLREITGMDNATGSRIAERAKDYTIRAPAVNRRLTG